MRPSALATVLLTAVALTAFAGNSLLCRMALGGRAIDPTSFSTVRLVSGALVLVPLAKLGAPAASLVRAGSVRSALALFGYAVAFSWAYVSLNTATGALIMFASVQVTMLAAGLAGGERLGPWQALGALSAAAGLGYLLLPGAAAPSLAGALRMLLAGCAWGLYSLWGRGVSQPLVITAANFAASAVPALLASACAFRSFALSPRGIALAAASGALTSGLGYAVWYRALRGHSALSAAVVQLAVPAIAALLGMLALGEQPSRRLAIASAAILGGIAATLLARPRRR